MVTMMWTMITMMKTKQLLLIKTLIAIKTMLNKYASWRQGRLLCYNNQNKGKEDRDDQGVCSR